MSTAAALPVEREVRRTSGLGSRDCRVGLVGAGFIAEHHLAAIRSLENVEAVSVCDVSRGRAVAFGEKFGLASAHGSLTSMLESERLDAVHVLVPPPYHGEVITEALEAGVHVFAEKPLALSSGECAELVATANRCDVRLGVNHNFVNHPSFQKLRCDVEDRLLGRVEHVISVTHVPLRQLSQGQLDHWMFAHYGNIVLEQAPHPLSQIVDLIGPVVDVDVRVDNPKILPAGRTFYGTWQVSMRCERGTASLHMSFGHETAHSCLTAIGQDGIARADLAAGTYSLRRATRYMEPVDLAVKSLREGRDLAAGGIGQLMAYARSMLLRGPRSDAFFRTMRGSMDGFYAALRDGTEPPLSGRSGQHVIEACERIIGAVRPAPVVVPDTTSTYQRPARQEVDVAVLGGTGFIGRPLVKRLLASGRTVRLLSRRECPPAELEHPNLEVVVGDLGNLQSVEPLVSGARQVVHLAAGLHDSWEGYENEFINGTRAVAEACMRAGVERFVYASSIAALYLGSAGERVSGTTATDPHPDQRAIYARAKILAEQMLGDLSKSAGLPLVILRPGLVIGAGGKTQHSGVGFWPNPIHCLAWGRGNLPLPFVLVDDVAEAFELALDVDEAAGQAFNLVGPVRPTAQEYVEMLCRESGRRVDLHPQPLWRQLTVDVFKWLVKKAAGKSTSPPSLRDLRTRSLAANFDCTDAQERLGWRPETDPARFRNRGIRDAIDAPVPEGAT